MTISNAAKEALIEVLDSKDETLRVPDAPAQGWPQTAVAPSEVDQLTSVEREWLIADERLWQRAHVIIAQNPALDVTDVYHTLRNFQRTPQERLRRGLRHGRTRARTE